MKQISYLFGLGATRLCRVEFSDKKGKKVEALQISKFEKPLKQGTYKMKRDNTLDNVDLDFPVTFLKFLKKKDVDILISLLEKIKEDIEE